MKTVVKLANPQRKLRKLEKIAADPKTSNRELVKTNKEIAYLKGITG